MPTPRVPEPALHFEIFKAKSLWYFRLKSSNGKIIAQSEGYNKKQSATKTVKKIMQKAYLAEVRYRK